MANQNTPLSQTINEGKFLAKQLAEAINAPNFGTAGGQYKFAEILQKIKINLAEMSCELNKIFSIKTDEDGVVIE